MCRAEVDLLGAAEHGNLAHLHQVDADRVVDLVVAAGQLLFAGVFQFVVRLLLIFREVVIHLVGQYVFGGRLGALAARGGGRPAGNRVLMSPYSRDWLAGGF